MGDLLKGLHLEAFSDGMRGFPLGDHLTQIVRGAEKRRSGPTKHPQFLLQGPLVWRLCSHFGFPVLGTPFGGMNKTLAIHRWSLAVTAGTEGPSFWAVLRKGK